MKKIILLSIFLIPIFCNAQSLGAERVKKLKESVVRVLIGNQPSGTAFFVNTDGMLASCWHVIEPAMAIDTATKKIFPVIPISIEFSSGEIIEVGIPNILLDSMIEDAIKFDFILLMPAKKPKTKFSFLEVGKFEDIHEGDAIVSNGYPLGIKQNFISTGILSSKWVSNDTVIVPKGDTIVVNRNVAWLDLTMNKGNSGGPIIKMGKTPQEDKVVGIATFILNPFAQDAEKLIQRSMNSFADFEVGGISLNKSNAFFAEAIYKNSIGVSGCVSINHLLKAIK